MKLVTTFVAVALAMGASISATQTIDLSKFTIIDLSHAYGPSTVFWPTSPKKFELEKLASGKTEGDHSRHDRAAADRLEPALAERESLSGR